MRGRLKYDKKVPSREGCRYAKASNKVSVALERVVAELTGDGWTVLVGLGCLSGDGLSVEY